MPLLAVLLYGCGGEKIKHEYETQLNEVKSLASDNLLLPALEILLDLENTLVEEGDEDLLLDLELEIEYIESLIEEEFKVDPQLAKVLIDIADNYGFIREDIRFHDPLDDFTVGIIYARLIDFNNDGQDELYVLFRSSQYADDDYIHRSAQGYIEEVWGAGISNPILLRHEVYPYDDESLASDLTLSFVEHDDGTVSIKHRTEKTTHGVQSWTYRYFSLTDDFYKDSLDPYFDEKVFYYHTGNEYEDWPAQYFIDDIEVDEQTFDQELGLREGNEIMIFESSDGWKEFSIYTSESFNDVRDIVSELTAYNNTDYYLFDFVSLTPELEKAFATYKNFRNVDVRDDLLYPSMLYDLIRNGLLKEDAEGIDYYSTAFTKKNIQETMKKYYDLDDIESLFFQFPIEFSDDNPTFVYKNETLYLIATDFYDQYQYIYTPEKVIELPGGYYAKVDVKAFDFWAFHEVHPDIDFSEFWDQPLEDWPAIAEPFIYEELPYYLVLKTDGDHLKLLYQGKYNLTDDEVWELLE